MSFTSTERGSTRVGITELEKQLMGPDASELREDLLRRLSDVELRLRVSMASGMPRTRFTDWHQALTAVLAARELINDLPPAPAGTSSSTIASLFRRASKCPDHHPST